jgi:hypothetical protein
MMCNFIGISPLEIAGNTMQRDGKSRREKLTPATEG